MATYDNRKIFERLGQRDRNRLAAFKRRLSEPKPKTPTAIERKLDQVIDLLSAQGESDNGK